MRLIDGLRLDHGRASRSTGLHGQHHAGADCHGCGVPLLPEYGAALLLQGWQSEVFRQTLALLALADRFLGHVGGFLFSAFGRMAGAHKLEQMPAGIVAQAGAAATADKAGGGI